MKRGKVFIGICVGVIIVLLVIVFYFVVNSNANLDVGDIDVGDINVGDIDVGKTNPMRGKSNKKRRQSLTKNYSFDNISDFSSFVVNHNVGEVIVGYNEGENIEVEATCFIEFYNQDDVDKIEENVDVIIMTKDNECLVAAVSKDDNTDLWDWVSENVENVNFSISLAISLPRSFVTYNVETDCGGIKLLGIEGNIKAKTDTGNIEVKDCIFEGDCSVSTDTGAISLEIGKSLEVKADIFVKTDTGNITLDLSGNNVEYKEKDKKSIKCVVNDICNLNATVDVGKISVYE